MSRKVVQPPPTLLHHAIPGEVHKKGPTVLRMGLLIDGAELSRFDAELVRKIQSTNIAEIVLVVRQELPGRSLLEKVSRGP